jgi:hypothetical protein
MAALAVILFASGCDCEGTLDPGRDGSIEDAGPLPPIEELRSLRIEPEDAVLVIDGPTPARQTYRAFGTYADGLERELTDGVSFALRSTRPIGSFARNQFTSGTAFGGRARVETQAGTVAAQTSLTLVLRRTREVEPTSGEPIPTNPASLFMGAEDPERAPRLVYPNDGVVIPPNLGRMEIHWLRGSPENTLFEIAFTNEVTDVRAYARCERPAGVTDEGCIWEPSGETWTWIAYSNAGGAPLNVQVRGTDDAGSAVGTSATLGMRFARDELRGTIYYWTVSDGGRIMRYDFGASAGAAEPVMGPETTTSGRCVGCHALSPDGTKLVGSVGGQNNGGMILMDLETFTPLRNQSAAGDRVLQFASFAPDGNTMVGVYGDDRALPVYGDLLLFDTHCTPDTMDTCGVMTGRIRLGGREASHPDWSPDGTRIAFTDVGRHNTSQRPLHGGISYVEREGDGWSGPRELVPRADGRNRYNPAHAPDSSFVVYNESVCPDGNTASRDCNADTDPSATMYAVPRAGGTPVALGRAQQRGALDDTDRLANTFPRFAPFLFVLDGGDLGMRRITWLSFSSTRRYGLREQLPSSSGESDRGTWVWVTAVDPEAVNDGVDPSFPAFVLPFQDLGTSNHIAVWTTESVGVPPIF